MFCPPRPAGPDRVRQSWLMPAGVVLEDLRLRRVVGVREADPATATGPVLVELEVVETAAPEPQEPIVLTFDRPFTFWLRDRGSGTVLFAGRVADPGSTRS